MKQSTHFISRSIISFLLLGAGVVTGYLLAVKTHMQPEAQQPPPVKAEAQQKILYWYDPMMPDTHFDKPGKSPYMDMDLIPKYADATTQGNDIRIDPRVTQNLGVKLGIVEKMQIPDAVENKTAADIFALPENNKNSTTVPKTHLGLVVPAEAVIDTGRHTFVIIAKADGYFEPREVTTAKTQNNKTEILSGLLEGEKIVTSGQFLIDSEANFSSAIKRMNNAEETP